MIFVRTKRLKTVFGATFNVQQKLIKKLVTYGTIIFLESSSEGCLFDHK